MKIYLVGGAVRDNLLGLPVKEKDWVVVGATPQEMLAAGYRQVGKDFPVFLHPVTHEEYALARIERKIGKGYTGFSFDASSTVSLMDDLKRRDLTINAIAQDNNGQIIDPYQGQHDLQNKVLRHVSPAFSEDPVRILRAARFAARFFDFSVAPETNKLMQNMVENGEVDALVAERVWKELVRALAETRPKRFFDILAGCRALPVLFPYKLHYATLEIVSEPILRFSLLTQFFSEEELISFSDRYKVPNEYRELASLVIRFQNVHLASALIVMEFLNALDAFRRQERFLLFCKVWKALGKDALLIEYFNLARNLTAQAVIAKGVSGKEINQKLFAERQNLIAKEFF